MKRSAFPLSPYSTPQFRLSPPTSTHPQSSTGPSHYPPQSQRCGPSTSAASSPPLAKRRRTEPPPRQNSRTSHPPTMSRQKRHGRRGGRNAETKAQKLLDYVDSGGPHRAAMVIDGLTGKHHLSQTPLCLPNTLCQKPTTPLNTQMSAWVSRKVAS